MDGSFVAEIISENMSLDNNNFMEYVSSLKVKDISQFIQELTKKLKL
jgi:hypothetical protein